MEIEPSSSGQVIAKKVWSILRIMLMMVKKGISKSKLILDLNVLLKRGNQVAGKAINGLLIHHSSLICRPNDSNNHFISPKEYEFSCSNSPAVGPLQQYLMTMAHYKKPTTKPKSNKQPGRYPPGLEDPTTVAAVQRVLEMINNSEGPASPLVVGMGVGGQPQYVLPGFGNGKSPLARQLRITDSPFPLKDGKGNGEEEEEDIKVNKAADDFIKKFYRNLKMQKSLESPYHSWAR